MSKSKTAIIEPIATQVQSLSIDDVLIDPANVRVHGDRNQATIRASLTRFRAGRSIVLDGNNVVRAGNGTVEQARQAGFDEVLVVEPKPNQLVAVKRPDWTASEATAYSVADNRSSEQAEWDDTALATTLRALQSEDFDLGAVGYSDDEVQGLIDRLAGEIVIPDPQPQQEPELKAEHFVEIYCSAADLESFRPIFETWEQRGSVTINIS
jgi:hypothetical protein